MVEELEFLNDRVVDQCRPIGRQIGLRLLEIVISKGPTPGAEFISVMPAVNVLPCRFGDKRHVCPLALPEGARRVPKDRGMPAVLMVKEIEDAFVFEQPGDEV